MRSLQLSMLAILVLAGVAPFVLPLKDGKPLLSFASVRMPPAPVSLPALPGTPSAPVTFYRWRDAEGGLHLSDAPPPEGIPYEAVQTDPAATNTMVAVKPQAPVGNTEMSAPIASPLDAYNPAKVLNLVNEAKGIEQTLRDRQQQQEQALRN